MTVTEASKRIGFSPSKLYQLVAVRKISHYRVGGKIVFHDEDIAAFLAGCRIPKVPNETASPMPLLKLKHITLHRGS